MFADVALGGAGNGMSAHGVVAMAVAGMMLGITWPLSGSSGWCCLCQTLCMVEFLIHGQSFNAFFDTLHQIHQ